MTEEKKQKGSKNEEIDPKLKELIEIMKLIQKEMPNAEKRSALRSFWNTREKEEQLCWHRKQILTR